MLELARLRIRRPELLDDVGLLRGIVEYGCLLESFEPCVDAAPSRRHEVDEEGEVVHPRVALGEKVALEPLQPADRLVQESADLGDVSCDGKHLDPQAVADGGPDVLGDRRLELGRSRGERLDLGPRALERRVQHCRLRTSGRRVRDPLLRALEGLGVHRS